MNIARLGYNIRADWVFLENMLEVAGLSMEIWKTRCTKHIDSRNQRVNNKVLG